MKRCILVLILCVWAVSVNAATFTNLGLLPGTSTRSDAFAISDDGSTIVGFSGWPNQTAFRWTTSSGMTSISNFSGWSIASAVSADGTYIVGSGSNIDYRWSTSSGVQSIDPLQAGNPNVFPKGISADGSVVVGRADIATQVTTTQTVYTPHAFRWTESGGTVAIGNLSGNPLDSSSATAVSADGSIIVGASQNGGSLHEAFYWTENNGMVGLGFLPGATTLETAASDISPDGLTIVGLAWDQAFRWTEQDGMVGLGFVPGYSTSSALAVSSNGDTIVGQVSSGSESRAFIWDSANGITLLDAYIASLGVNLSGWTLESAVDISADGMLIVGNGVNPDGYQEAWAINLASAPIPASVWLFGSGLLGLMGAVRRKRAS